MSEAEPRENITFEIIEEEQPETNNTAVEYDLDKYEYELERYRRIKESMTKANKKYRVNHKEYVNQKQREYYAKNKEDEDFLERIRSNSSRYYHTHKEAIKERRDKKRAEKKEMEPPKEKKLSKRKQKEERWKNADKPREEHILMII